MCRTAFVLIGAAGLSAGLAMPVLAQDGGSLLGTVFDQQTLQPLAGATIMVEGHDGAIVSHVDGSFVLNDLPPGRLTIRISATDYSTSVEQIEVTSGELTFQQFTVLPVSATLAEVFVRAGRERPSGASIAVLETTGRASAITAADLLAQRVPGISVTRASGTIGAGARVQIRGINSITQSTAPAIYLDGVRIDQESSNDLPMRSPPVFDVLDAIPATHVKSIRVLRGAAASARYGDSTNGVILIETHGSDG